MRPDRLIVMEEDDRHGKFRLYPLEVGFATIIGNSMRRLLLSSIEGSAFCSVKVDGVLHEFDAIPGVMQDMTNIILNLKEVLIRPVVPGATKEHISILVSDMTRLTAGNLSLQMSQHEVINKDLVICEMDSSASFCMELDITRGRGYISSDEQERNQDDMQTIMIDSIFSPIVRVNYKAIPIDPVDGKAREELLLEVDTNGTIRPKAAVLEAARLMIQHLSLINQQEIIEAEPGETENDLDEETLRVRQLLLTPISDLNLTVRAFNCLRAADVNTLMDLVSYERPALLRFRNFGMKSLREIDDMLNSVGLEFGMDVSKYKF